jgi:toxin secretion/phage lysis holin
MPFSKLDYGLVAAEVTPVITLVFIDFVLGFILAWKERRLSSSGAKKTIYKIAAYICTWMAFKLASAIPALEVPMLTMASGVAALAVIVELISILENANKLGLKLPGWIRQRLEKLKDQLDDSERKDNNPQN